MFEYTGAADATRVSAEELSASEVEARVCALTLLKVGEAHAFDPPVTPFSTENPVPEVNLRFLLFVLDVLLLSAASQSLYCCHLKGSPLLLACLLYPRARGHLLSRTCG